MRRREHAGVGSYDDWY